jgi:hypothetical protein
MTKIAFLIMALCFAMASNMDFEDYQVAHGSMLVAQAHD